MPRATTSNERSITVDGTVYTLTRVAVSHLRAHDSLFGISESGTVFRRTVAASERLPNADSPLWQIRTIRTVRSDSEFPLNLDMGRAERVPYFDGSILPTPRRGNYFLSEPDVIIVAHLLPRPALPAPDQNWVLEMDGSMASATAPPWSRYA